MPSCNVVVLSRDVTVLEHVFPAQKGLDNDEEASEILVDGREKGGLKQRIHAPVNPISVPPLDGPDRFVSPHENENAEEAEKGYPRQLPD